jgi:hypothetical protein
MGYRHPRASGVSRFYIGLRFSLSRRLSGKCAAWNGRTCGLKAHVVYDRDADRPVYLEITGQR